MVEFKVYDFYDQVAEECWCELVCPGQFKTDAVIIQ